MSAFSLQVVFELVIFAAINEVRWWENRTLHTRHFTVQSNLPGCEFGMTEELVHQSNDSVEAFLRILDLIAVNVSHLASILREVVG